ncbi:unnamed protein product [Lota lota]
MEIGAHRILFACLFMFQWLVFMLEQLSRCRSLRAWQEGKSVEKVPVNAASLSRSTDHGGPARRANARRRV